MKNKLDELAIMKWQENYKFRLFIDLAEQGAELKNLNRIDLDTKKSRDTLHKKVVKLYKELKQLDTKHKKLIEQLDSEGFIDYKPLAAYRSELLRVKYFLENVTVKSDKIGGSSMIKGYSANYLNTLLNEYKYSELEWLKKFIREEISNKTFAKKLFIKFPKNITFLNINESPDSNREWYKNLKAHVKKPKDGAEEGESFYSKISDFEVIKMNYIGILKTLRIEHSKNLKEILTEE